MKRLVITLIFPLLFSTSYAQNEDSVFIRTIANEILAHGTAYDNLRVLTKQIGARLTGSPQMLKAEQWGEKALKTAGAEKVWLQECMVPHWIRCGKDAGSASYTDLKGRHKKTLAITALGNSIGSMETLTAPAIEIKNFDELVQKKEQVKGKIVFYNYPFNPLFIRTFDSYADAYKYRKDGASEAAKYGAKAVIVRSMTHTPGNDPHTGALNYANSLPRLPAVAIGLDDADWLSNQLQKGTVSVSILTHGRFLPDTIGHNVIAEIKGSQFPD